MYPGGGTTTTTTSPPPVNTQTVYTTGGYTPPPTSTGTLPAISLAGLYSQIQASIDSGNVPTVDEVINWIIAEIDSQQGNTGQAQAAFQAFVNSGGMVDVLAAAPPAAQIAAAPPAPPAPVPAPQMPSPRIVAGPFNKSVYTVQEQYVWDGEVTRQFTIVDDEVIGHFKYLMQVQSTKNSWTETRWESVDPQRWQDAVNALNAARAGLPALQLKAAKLTEQAVKLALIGTTLGILSYYGQRFSLVGGAWAPLINLISGTAGIVGGILLIESVRVGLLASTAAGAAHSREHEIEDLEDIVNNGTGLWEQHTDITNRTGVIDGWTTVPNFTQMSWQPTGVSASDYVAFAYGVAFGFSNANPDPINERLIGHFLDWADIPLPHRNYVQQ